MSNLAYRSIAVRTALAALTAALLCSPTPARLPNGAASSATGRRIPIPGHFSPAMAISHIVGRLPSDEPVDLAIALPLRNQAELNELLTRLYDPADPMYAHYLSPEDFTARFGPTRAAYDALIGFARSQGLAITATHANRALLDVSGPAGAVETAFQVHLLRFQMPNGRLFRGPDAEPSVPTELAGVVSGVVGLDDAAVWRPSNLVQRVAPSPLQTGSGPGGALSPANIRTAYNLTSVSETGTGQTLGLFELDGYTATDVTSYESYFGLPNVPLQNVLVDGFSGRAGTGAAEVTLDIELQIALAPGATKVIVYEGPNSGAGVVDTYNRIATDNIAKQVSTSWGLPEASNTSSARNAENTAFQQMAAQGQSIYAASGDSGAYDNGSTLSVDDPASQPYMVGVGGTHLATNGAGGAWSSETTWNGGSISNGGGGGGISTIWSIPSWQSGVVSAASKGSTTMRNVPDVSLDSDPNTGYSIFYKGGWAIYGGTSCAAPLWAGYTARVNQRRLANGSSLLGFANPAIYQVAKGSGYASSFHDIADGSTNLYYPAVTGFDDATGWGTFNGANLLAALAPGSVSLPGTPSGLTAAAGNGQVSLAWSASAGATSYSVFRGTSPGGESTTAISTGITTTSFVNTGLTNGTTYYYKVKAVNSAGSSGLSNEASATPTSGTSGPATKVIFTTQPVGGVAGQPLTTQPVVKAVDANGNVVTSFTGPITVGLEVSTNPQGAVLNGTRTLNAVNGVAAFSGLSVSLPGTGYLMYTVVLGSNLIATDSAPFNVTASSGGVATTVVFKTQPVGGVAGQPLSTQPVAAVVDANGNIVTSFTGQITVGLEVSTNPQGAVMSGTRTLTAVNGVATFSGLSVNLAGNGYLMYAVVLGSNLTATDSAPFNVAPSSGGVATMVVFKTQPVGGVAGQPLTTQPVVVAVDANGNTVTSFTGPITVGLEVSTNPQGAVMSGTRTLNAVNGVATFSGLSVNLPGTGYLMYTVVLNSNLIATDSAPFNVN